MLGATSTVEVRVDQVTRGACKKLQDVLSAWACWCLQQPSQGDNGLDAELLQGVLQLDTVGLVDSGALIWQDKLLVVPGAAAVVPEEYEVPDVPCYERGTGELLAPAAVNKAVLLPGGAAAAKRRQLAEACSNDWVDGANNDGPSVQPVATKRQRVSLKKCHNCGSYAHPLQKCPLQLDQERVNAAVAEAKAERGPRTGGPPVQMWLRYFDGPMLGSPTEQQPEPGKLSSGLAAALGMSSETAPPPWLSRMVVLGVPPNYAAACDQEAEQLFTVHTGSDDEGGDDDTAAAASAGIATVPGAAAAAAVQDGGSDDDEGLIPFSVVAAEEAASAVSLLQRDGAGGARVADEQQLDRQSQQMRESQQQQQEEQQQEEQRQEQQPQQPQQEPSEAAVDRHPHQVKAAAVSAPGIVFPGLNAAVPAGAHEQEWARALGIAASLKAQLG